MDENLFFPKTVRREIRIRTYAGLIGKAPEKAKRLKLSISMPLSGKASVGMPGWLGDDYEFVSKTQSTVVNPIQFPGVNLEFSADDMFSKAAKAPKASLTKFSVVSVGEKEEPEVEVQFIAYVPFTTAFNAWCGQFVGDLVWASFDLIGGASSIATSPPAGGDDGDEPSEEETKLFAADSAEMGPEHDALYASPNTKTQAWPAIQERQTAVIVPITASIPAIDGIEAT